MSMAWHEINQKIKQCKAIPNLEERINCLRRLFAATQDGMVAFALGEELEASGNVREALYYFKMAEKLFPLEKYKAKARAAISQVLVELKRLEGTLPVRPTFESVGIEGLDLNQYDLNTTLFVVACTKTKTWNMDRNAPIFVPAQFAYIGPSFLKFLEWKGKVAAESRKEIWWLILSAKYGFIEPWHPISYYDVTFDNEASGPISNETLYRQVMSQTRFSGIPLKNFKTVICWGSKTYADKVRDSFKDTGATIIHINIE